ncbi:MAG: hypothetical protein MJ193_02745, partial [Clostridia bacterium]|nr:hypothetical protein [Clostridia bacterium]
DKKIDMTALEPNRNVLRVYMRFNEPVQIVGTAPKLEYSINMALSSRTYTMDYIGGAGTDTLVFGLDLSTFDNNIEIKSIHPMKVINGSNIKDYGYAMGLHSYLSGSNTLIPTADQPGSSGLKTYFDARTPSIKPPTLPKEGTVLASHTIEVTVNSMPLNQQNNEQSGKLYYVWSQSATTAPKDSEFTQEIPRYNGSDSTFRFTTGGLTGNWYLWLRAVSYVGKTSALSTGVGPYHFDNQAPTVKNVTVSSPAQAVQEHHFEFDIENVPVDCASKIETVRLIYSQSPIWVEGETELNERIIYSTSGTTAPGYVTPTVVNPSTTHWQFDLNYKWFGIEDNSYGKFYFQIVAQDALGNTLTPAEYTPTKTASGEPLQVNYDSRSLIESSHVWQDAIKISEDDSQPVIDIENISTKTPKLVITLSDLTIDAADEYTFTIEKPNVDNQLERVTTYTKANKDTCPWFSFALSGSTITITAKNISTLNGYYDIGFSILKNGSDLKFIENISFYFSHGYGIDEPANYSAISKGNLLINELYMMGSSALYYYKDADGATQYETYGQAVFSTASAAMNYIRFLEYQDLSLYVIPSDAAAQDLTNGFGSYVMADGYYGSKTAHKGEIWIRYKAKTWVDSGANSAWRYYYYKPAGSLQTIDVNNLGSDGILN